ncbi:MAG: family 78 glycoside hydrolase catalytic domain [Mobilitalea sp.]
MKKSIDNILCQYRKRPLGIDSAPVITWNCNGMIQKRCRIQVKEENKEIVHDTGWIMQRLPYIPLEIQLKSRMCYYYTVFIEDTEGNIHRSMEEFFETGLLLQEDFYAKWITADCDAPCFAKDFHLTSKVQKARIYYSGLGYGYLFINGKRVGNQYHAPVWSDYHERNLQSLLYPIKDTFSFSTYYLTLDVAEYLQEGENVISIMLGNGFYNQSWRDVEGKMEYGLPRLFLQLEMETEEGSFWIASDECFGWTQSPVIFNQIFRGEIYDARLEEVCRSAVINRSLQPARLAPEKKCVMRGQICPPDQIIKSILPVLVTDQGEKKVYDLGENISGVVRIQTDSEAGTHILLRFSEEIDEYGELDFQSTGGTEQIQQDEYIANGKKGQEYMPLFVWHGFRYVEVVGNCTGIEALVIHTAVEKTGEFACDNEILNFIYEAYSRSQMDNLHGCIPSDCPHRERLGYTGDGQITADTAMFCFDMPAVYKKWMQDILDCQCQKSGHVQHTAPFAGGGGGPGGWGCAVILVPYVFWLHYGDLQLLERCYEPMCRWMSYLETCAQDYIIVHEEEKGWCLGDWAFAVEDFQISESLVNTYYYCKCAGMMAEIAGALRRTEHKRKFGQLREKILAAFEKVFYQPDKYTYDSGRHAAAVFALDLGLGGEKEAEVLIEYYKSRRSLDTGIFGTPILIDYLFRHGEGQLAIELMTRRDAPSFGWMLQQKATTLWEYFFDGFSHNHPMFGSVVGVLIRNVLGIDPTVEYPGFEKLIIRPCFDCGLTHAKGYTQTPFGRLMVHWIKKEDEILFCIELPCGIEACLQVYGKSYSLAAGKNEVHHTFRTIDKQGENVVKI